MEQKSAADQRAEWRDRKQRSRDNRAAEEQADELRELTNELKKAIRESPDGMVPRSFFLQYGCTATLKAMEVLKIGPVPGVSAPDSGPHPDPEFIKRRSDKFDLEKTWCERKATEESRRTLWGLTHRFPIGWASVFPSQFPSVLENLKGEV